MKRRRILLFSLILLILAAGTGLIIGKILPRKRTIVFSLYSGNSWNVPQNFVYAIYDKAIEMFHSFPENQDVRIVLKTGTMHKDYSEWFAQLVLKGREPDIFLIIEEDFSTYASIGLLEPLEPYLENKDFNKDDFYLKALEAGRYKGRQYSLPIAMVPSFMIVNRSLLAEKGIDIDMDSWTWSQFRDICRELTEDSNQDGVIDRFGIQGYNWRHAFHTNDKALFADDAPKIRFHDKNMEEVIDHLKELHHLNQGIVVSEKDFAHGHVGFKIFNLSEYRAYGTYPYRIMKYGNFEWNAIPLPKGPSGISSSKLYTVQVGMSSRSRNKKIASDFIKFMASNEGYQLEVWEGTNTMPVIKSVMGTIYGDQAHQNEETNILNRQILEEIIENSYIDPNFKSYSYYDRMIEQRIFQIVAQDLDTKTSVQSLRREIDQWTPGG